MERGYVSTLYQVTCDSSGKALTHIASEELHTPTPPLALKSYLSSLMSPRKPGKKSLSARSPGLMTARSPRLRKVPSAMAKIAPSVSPLLSPIRMRRPARLESMVTTCTQVQQSLTNIWQSACESATGSLQLLETSRRTIASANSLINPWKHNPKYEKGRAALEAHMHETHGLKSLQLLSKALARQASGLMDEDDGLLDEIRKFKRPGVDLGDTFKISTLAHPKGCATDRTPKTPSAISQLNQFIFKENSKYLSKSVAIERHKRMVEAAMQNIEASPEVLEKARQLAQREKRRAEHKKIFVANLLTVEEKQERQQLLLDIKTEQSDLRTKWRIEDMYHKTSVKQFNGRPV